MNDERRRASNDDLSPGSDRAISCALVIGILGFTLVVLALIAIGVAMP
jgi:hypothetical protein